MPAARSTRRSSKSAAGCSASEAKLEADAGFWASSPPLAAPAIVTRGHGGHPLKRLGALSRLRWPISRASRRVGHMTWSRPHLVMADAVVGARKGQKTPDGYYNVERMLKRVRAGKGRILLCGTCMDARGMIDDDHHGWRQAQHHG